MTLTLEISAEVEREIRAAAEATGTDVQAFVVQAAQKEARTIQPVGKETKEERRHRRQQAIRQARGVFASLPFSIDHLEEKRAENALEEAKAYGHFDEPSKDLSE